MIIFVFIIAAVVLYGIKPAEKNQYYDACSHRQTSMINGIFTMLILVSHASMYMDYGGVWIDDAYGEFRSYLGQFVVAPFLFYSGFGIMESIAKKGNNYVKSIPQKRFFKVWYHFALALIPFVILDVMWSDNISISNILLSFTGYKNMGNSSWYMFDAQTPFEKSGNKKYRHLPDCPDCFSRRNTFSSRIQRRQSIHI